MEFDFLGLQHFWYCTRLQGKWRVLKRYVDSFLYGNHLHFSLENKCLDWNQGNGVKETMAIVLGIKTLDSFDLKNHPGFSALKPNSWPMWNNLPDICTCDWGLVVLVRWALNFANILVGIGKFILQVNDSNQINLMKMFRKPYQGKYYMFSTSYIFVKRTVNKSIISSTKFRNVFQHKATCKLCAWFSRQKRNENRIEIHILLSQTSLFVSFIQYCNDVVLSGIK